jgi:hypothetical protein
MVPVTMEEWLREYDPYEEGDYGERITDYQGHDDAHIERSWRKRPDGAAGV